MKIHMRLDDSNAGHTRVTAFINGANCGQLTMRTADEITHFLMIVRHGISPKLDVYLESGELWVAPEP